jgi:pimeloyl-ACP methyl ester carboxylesterase
MRSRFLYFSSLVALTLFGLSCERQPESPASVVSADGVTIRYEVHGSGEPALVFVHGWSCDRSYWDRQVPYFSERYRVVTIDLGGHGESGLEREVWSMKAFGQDVAAVVDALGLEQVVLVGHSLGGPVVVEAARLLGDRVKIIVGVETFNDVGARYSEDQIEAQFQPFEADFSGSMRQWVRQAFLPTSDSALMEQIAEDMSSSPPAVAFGAAEQMYMWYNDESTEALRDVRVPVHLINSDYRPTNVNAAREYFPQLDVVLMSGVGHFVMIEDPDTFNRLLSEIVEGVRTHE